MENTLFTYKMPNGGIVSAEIMKMMEFTFMLDMKLNNIADSLPWTNKIEKRNEIIRPRYISLF